MIAFDSSAEMSVQAVDVPLASGVFNVTTSGPDTPAGPLWMWAAVAGVSRLLALRL
jgi:hypothetical protein